MKKIALCLLAAIAMSGNAAAQQTELRGVTIDVSGLTSGATADEVLKWWDDVARPDVELVPYEKEFSVYSKGEMLNSERFQWAMNVDTQNYADEMHKGWFAFTGPATGNRLVQFQREIEYSNRLTAPRFEDTVAAVIAKYGEPSFEIKGLIGQRNFGYVVKDGAIVKCEESCNAGSQPYDPGKIEELASMETIFDYVLTVNVDDHYDDDELVGSLRFNMTDRVMLREAATAEMQILLDQQAAVLATATPSKAKF